MSDSPPDPPPADLPVPQADAVAADAGSPACLPVYDPADYRWVPVRRRPRYDGWTEEKQRRFIETLADTGVVGLAAKEVGMTRESAYKLRRSPQAAAFARAWDAARHHAGGYLEDVAFERAIEGVEHDVFNEYGEVICTKRVHNDRLLMFLLRHLKPERYARDALAAPVPQPSTTVDASLRALEPPLPAPVEALLDAESLADELSLAEAGDGTLPHFLSEQRPRKSEEKMRVEAQEARGDAAWQRMRQGDEPSHQEFADMCRSIDPAGRSERPRKRYR